MSVDHVASHAVQTPVQANPLYSAAKADAGTVAELVVQSYKVEANSMAVRNAGTLFEAYTGKLRADEIRLATYANQKNPTEEGLKKIKADIDEVTAFLATVHKGIIAALDAMDAAAKASDKEGRGVGGVGWYVGGEQRYIQRSGQSWTFKGFQANFDAESQLPVKASAESIQLHRSLIDQYKEEITAVEKALVGRPSHSGSKPVDPSELERYVGWLKAEVDKTHASLQQAEGKLQTWTNLGLTAHFESKLPVRPDVNSMRSHKELLARYEQELQATDKVLVNIQVGLDRTLTYQEVSDRKRWLQNEIGQTYASLQKTQEAPGKDIVQGRDQTQREHDQAKASYDTLCLELSTINDNGVDRNPARAAVLKKDIAQLELSMKDAKEYLEVADSIIGGTYIPAR